MVGKRMRPSGWGTQLKSWQTLCHGFVFASPYHADQTISFTNKALPGVKSAPPQSKPNALDDHLFMPLTGTGSLIVLKSLAEKTCTSITTQTHLRLHADTLKNHQKEFPRSVTFCYFPSLSQNKEDSFRLPEGILRKGKTKKEDWRPTRG